MNSIPRFCSRAARLTVACGFFVMTATGALAADPITVANAWVRTNVPGQTVSAAYMNITPTVDIMLLGVATPIAGKAELHRTTYKDGVMKMRAIKKLEIPAGQIANLEPGGYHVMLTDVKRELKDGEHVPLTLTVQTSKGVTSKVTVDAEVRFVPAKHEHMPQ